MSDVGEKELSDIELCYKAMGLSFSDNPEVVEKTYRKLKDEYSKTMHSSDHAQRAVASENMKQLEELFTTITGSMIYKDYAREFAKYQAIHAEKLAERKLKQQQQAAVKEELFSCPYCKKLIAKKMKICIYCHGKILTPVEQLISKVFSKRNMIILGIVLLLVAVGVVLKQYPQLLQR